MPPTSPAATPNTSRPIARRLRCGAMRIISPAAKATVTTLAIVNPGSPADLGEHHHDRIRLCGHAVPVDHHQERGVVEQMGESKYA